jgi:DNA repair protein RadC
MVYTQKLYRVMSMHDVPAEQKFMCDTPGRVWEYWQKVIAANPQHDPSRETAVVIHVNTRRRAIGYHIVCHGTIDSLLVHPREVFRAAIVSNASAIVMVHNHPSGEPMPSEADIRITSDIRKAGDLLRVDLLDHVIIGETQFNSLRTLGYFA